MSDAGPPPAPPAGDAGDADPVRIMRRALAENLADLETWRMPFGRFRGRPLHALPFEYLHWFVERGDGFPPGRLGELMEFVYQTKSAGAETIFAGLSRGRRGPSE